jgi:hypothetical protein
MSGTIQLLSAIAAPCNLSSWPPFADGFAARRAEKDHCVRVASYGEFGVFTALDAWAADDDLS